MGSFNTVCNVTNLVMERNQRAAITIITKNNSGNDGSMIVDNIDNYVPISLPFIGDYEDYGRFTPVKEKKIRNHNRIAWRVFSTLFQGVQKSTDESKQRNIHVITANVKSLLQDFIEECHINLHDQDADTIDENIYQLFKYIVRLDSSSLSMMPVDYSVFDRTNNYQNTSSINDLIYGINLELNDFEKKTVETFSRDFIRNIRNVVQDDGDIQYYDGSFTSAVKAVKVLKEHLEYPEIKLHEALYDKQRVISVTQDEAAFYQVLFEEIDNDFDNITPFIDAYLFREVLEELHVPYAQMRYGSQRGNLEITMQAMVGGIETIIDRIYEYYTDTDVVLGGFLTKHTEEELRGMNEDLLKNELAHLSIYDLASILEDNFYRLSKEHNLMF